MGDHRLGDFRNDAGMQCNASFLAVSGAFRDVDPTFHSRCDVTAEENTFLFYCCLA